MTVILKQVQVRFRFDYIYNIYKMIIPIYGYALLKRKRVDYQLLVRLGGDTYYTR